MPNGKPTCVNLNIYAMQIGEDLVLNIDKDAIAKLRNSLQNMRRRKGWKFESHRVKVAGNFYLIKRIK